MAREAGLGLGVALPEDRRHVLTSFEVGAGTGATAASGLPAGWRSGARRRRLRRRRRRRSRVVGIRNRRAGRCGSNLGGQRKRWCLRRRTALYRGTAHLNLPVPGPVRLPESVKLRPVGAATAAVIVVRDAESGRSHVAVQRNESTDLGIRIPVCIDGDRAILRRNGPAVLDIATRHQQLRARSVVLRRDEPPGVTAQHGRV